MNNFRHWLGFLISISLLAWKSVESVEEIAPSPPDNWPRLQIYNHDLATKTCYYFSKVGVFPYIQSPYPAENNGNGTEVNRAKETCQSYGTSMATIDNQMTVDYLLTAYKCKFLKSLGKAKLSVQLGNYNSLEANDNLDRDMPCIFLDPNTNTVVSQENGEGCLLLESGLDPEPKVICSKPEACPSPKERQSTVGCFPEIPNDAAESGLRIAPNQDFFCAGSAIELSCQTGGAWNKFIDDPTKSSMALHCDDQLQIAYPDQWPICGAEPHCPVPESGSRGMSNNYSPSPTGDNRIVNRTVTYDCDDIAGKVVPRADIGSGITENIAARLTLTCMDNGQWDKNINDYSCTPNCPLPNYDRLSMRLTWNSQSLPQYGDKIRINCKDGHNITTWDNMNEDLSKFWVFRSVTLTCKVTGSFEPALFKYVCTRHCEAPAKVDQWFKHDWTRGDPTTIDTVIRYSCENEAKSVVRLNDSSVSKTLDSLCLFNGKYSVNMEDYNCTVCDRPNDVTNGFWDCNSPYFALGSSCNLICNRGFMVAKEHRTTCIKDGKRDVWDKDQDLFKCERPINFIAGGINSDQRYLQEVELVSNNNCHGREGPELPHGTVGAATGFLNGNAFICGGAIEEYDQCVILSNGIKQCGRNTNCVTTAGGTKWCSGPKTNQCYVWAGWNWLAEFTLNIKRAFAATVQLPDGQLWVLGGIGKSSILTSTELIRHYGPGNWSATYGPDLPEPRFKHCATLLPDRENVLVIGGFGREGYIQSGLIYNLKQRRWLRKSYFSPKGGGRIDHFCGTFWIRDEENVIVMGGSKNDGGVHQAEIFMEDLETWQPLGKYSNKTLKAGAILDMGGEPYIVGAVQCEHDDMANRDVCEKSDSIFFYQVDTNQDASFINDTWTEKTGAYSRISSIKSSVMPLRIPRTSMPGCSNP